MLNSLKSYLNPSELFHNIRFYILVINFTIGMTIFVYFTATIPDVTPRAIQFTEFYAFLAVINLYLAVLATPLLKLFPSLPLAQTYLKARRALGVSAFLFSVMHVRSAFFDELGGFDGLGFLSSKYLIAISLSVTALVILLLMASTSFDFIIAKLTFKKWKKIHRLVYLIVLLVTIHALMLGGQFSDLSGTIPQIFLGALVILLGLESIRFDKYLRSKWLALPSFGLSFGLCLFLVAGIGVLLYAPTGGGNVSPFNIHAAHIQLAQQAQQGQGFLPKIPGQTNNPALIGDRTKRYTVSFLHSDQVSPNQDTNLSFKINDASSGNPVDLFQFVYTKTMHLVIVDNELNYFNHIHPTQNGSSFDIQTQFPHPGRYHLYVDFQPLGAIEQQFAFTLDVGNVTSPAVASQPVDTSLTKTFDKYQVTLTPSAPLVATDMSIGKQTLSFNIKDALTGQPITTLKPYLAAYGHLVLINESTYDYIHVHPSNLVPPAPDASSGPEVDFLPLGLYGPIKPGIYRVFGQFNPDNNLFTSDFTININ